MVTNLEKYGTKKWTFLGKSTVCCIICNNKTSEGFRIWHNVPFLKFPTNSEFCSMDCINIFLPKEFEGHRLTCISPLDKYCENLVISNKVSDRRSCEDCKKERKNYL